MKFFIQTQFQYCPQLLMSNKKPEIFNNWINQQTSTKTSP